MPKMMVLKGGPCNGQRVEPFTSEEDWEKIGVAVKLTVGGYALYEKRRYGFHYTETVTEEEFTKITEQPSRTRT